MKHLFIFLFLIPVVSFGQTAVKQSGLNTKFERLKALSGDELVSEMAALGWDYHDQNKDTARMLLDSAMSMVERVNDVKVRGKVYHLYGTMFFAEGDYAEAKEYLLRGYELRKQADDIDPEDMALSMLNLAMSYDGIGDQQNFLRYILEADSIVQNQGASQNKVNILVQLSEAFESLEKIDRAQALIQESVALSKTDEEIAMTHNNYANFLMRRGRALEAKEFLEVSLEAEERMGNTRGLMKGKANLAILNYQLGDPETSKALFEEVLAYNLEHGGDYEKSQSTNNLAFFFYMEGQYGKAIPYARQSLRFAESAEAAMLIRERYQFLSELYAKEGDFELAYEWLGKFLVVNDSLFDQEKMKEVEELSAKYETNKKESEIEMLKQQAALDDARNEQLEAERREEQAEKRLLGIGLGLAAVLVIFILIGLYQNRIKNKVLTVKNDEIEQKNKALQTANVEIEEKNKEITDSIQYAKRIQSAILPPNRIVKEYLESSFILYKPKDIVAGDFYWLEHEGDTILFAAADCTGHGVPGAMVSVICNNGLNRSVREHGLTDPADILNKTREIVIQEFEKSEEEVKDGMDVALIAMEGSTIRYAGANNPLWVVKTKELSTPVVGTHEYRQALQREFELLEIKADKQPIGKYASEKPFTSHTLELNAGDTLYIFSDGYVDQFGGEKGKKFKSANFKKLLLSIQHETMERQREILDTRFEEWRGDIEQIDDVCVIGVRV